MAGTTVGMMLDSAKDFERMLGNFLADIRDRAKDDDVRLLTYYLARFKNHLPGIEGIFTAQEYERIRRIPLKDMDVSFISERCFDGKYVASNARAHELLETAAELIDTLLCFYRWLARQPVEPGAQGLLDQLVILEESGLHKLRKIQQQTTF